MTVSVAHDWLTMRIRTLLQPPDDTEEARHQLAIAMDDHYHELSRQLGDASGHDAGLRALAAAIQALREGADVEVVAVHLREHLDTCQLPLAAHTVDESQPVNDTERRYGLNESPV